MLTSILFNPKEWPDLVSKESLDHKVVTCILYHDLKRR